MENKTYDITVTTLFGLEKYCADELRRLGIEELKIENRAVSFRGTKCDLYNCNLWLRTAIRVLLPIRSFKVQSDTDLYNNVKKIPWENYFSEDQTFIIEPVVASQLFRHTGYAALKAKDALVDRFRDKSGKRPSVNKEFPDIHINLHITGNDVLISLDSSGEPLFKRGYRKQTGFAPLNETLAAGMLYASGWKTKGPLIDPMCGSGTLICEAALMASNTAPGLIRNEFSFMNWPDFEPELWGGLYAAAERKRLPFTNSNLFGFDNSRNMIEIAKRNWMDTAFKDIKHDFGVKDFFTGGPPTEHGLVIFNPPYGERLKLEDAIEFYKKIGDKLKADYDGFDVWIVSSNKNAFKHLGLRPSKKMALYNGSLEVKFQKYEMYRGSRKTKHG